MFLIIFFFFLKSFSKNPYDDFDKTFTFYSRQTFKKISINFLVFTSGIEILKILINLLIKAFVPCTIFLEQIKDLNLKFSVWQITSCCSALCLSEHLASLLDVTERTKKNSFQLSGFYTFFLQRYLYECRILNLFENRSTYFQEFGLQSPEKRDFRLRNDQSCGTVSSSSGSISKGKKLFPP